MNLNILYEDNHLMVVVKPVGILSQEDYTKDDDMLNILKSYIKKKYCKRGNVYLGLIHRLDRMTSGIMVFARTSKAASRLNDQIRDHTFNKKYLAIVDGYLEGSCELVNWLVKDEREVKSHIVNFGGKISKLYFSSVVSYHEYSIIDIVLKTGRHHQIRVQMASIGHPLRGDKLYGSNVLDKMRLHAYLLGFNHPISGEYLEFINYPNWYDEKSKILKVEGE